MVEEPLNNKPKAKNPNKPKLAYSWTSAEVQKWFKRHCIEHYALYADKFLQQDITGRALLRMNDNSLLRLGITDQKHRESILRAILKLKLRTDIIEMKDMQQGNMNNMVYEYCLA